MKYLLILLTVCSHFISRADAWDNLTMEEAKAVVKYLEDNPYIFDYCDCCDVEESDDYTIHFVKVTSPHIVECEWDKSFYSVEYNFQPLADIVYKKDGSGYTVLEPRERHTPTLTLFMNYTWGFEEESKMAHPFFDLITYDYYGSDSKPCRDFFYYPTPKELSAAGKFNAYKQWYKWKNPAVN